jgi:molybdopterin-synthase adenylyltransferase
LIGALQVTMALQILSGHSEAVPRRITTIDLWHGTMRQIEQPARDPQCRVCGQRIFDHLTGVNRAPISLCGRNAVQIHERKRPVDLTQLARSLEPLGEVRANEFALRFLIAPYELTVFADGRAIIKGTQDAGIARSLYARYVGA